MARRGYPAREPRRCPTCASGVIGRSLAYRAADRPPPSRCVPPHSMPTARVDAPRFLRMRISPDLGRIARCQQSLATRRSAARRRGLVVPAQLRCGRPGARPGSCCRGRPGPVHRRAQSAPSGSWPPRSTPGRTPSSPAARARDRFARRRRRGRTTARRSRCRSRGGAVERRSRRSGGHDGVRDPAVARGPLRGRPAGAGRRRRGCVSCGTADSVRALVIAAVQRRHVDRRPARCPRWTAGCRSAGVRSVRRAVRRGLLWRVVAAGARCPRGLRAARRSCPRIWPNPELFAGDGDRLPSPDGWIDEVGLAIQVHSREYHLRGRGLGGHASPGDTLLGSFGVPVLAVTPPGLAADPAGFVAPGRAGVPRARCGPGAGPTVGCGRAAPASWPGRRGRRIVAVGLTWSRRGRRTGSASSWLQPSHGAQERHGRVALASLRPGGRADSARRLA